jgi:hypothetical protein
MHIYGKMQRQWKAIHLLTMVISGWWNYGSFSPLLDGYPQAKLQWLFAKFLDWGNYSNTRKLTKPGDRFDHGFKSLLIKNF